ncbi:hypothetical protein BH09MYX1_BH09MYX1_50760 [soil metagenome]
MWPAIREGGSGAAVAIACAFVGLVLALVGFVSLPKPANAQRFAIAALVFAVLAPMAGLLGMAKIHYQAKRYAENPSLGQGTRAAGIYDGIVRAHVAAEVGLATGAFVLLLAAISARESLRRSPHPARKKAAPAIGATAVAMLGGAVAVALGPLPPPVSTAEMELRDARGNVDVSLGNCTTFAHVLRESYWHPTTPTEWPRRFDPDPRRVIPDFDVTATRCARARFAEAKVDWPMNRGKMNGVDAILVSPLLVDDALEAEIRAFIALPTAPVPESDHTIGPSFAASSLFGTVSLGTPTIKGNLPEVVVERIVHQNLERFRRCYDDALHRDAKLAGRVTLGFVIDAKGTVTNPTATPLTDGTLHTCLVDALKPLAFPSLVDGASSVGVSYPIDLAP